MGIPDVGALSLGQWTAIVKAWNAAHASEDTPPAPPTVDEFELAYAKARGLH